MRDMLPCLTAHEAAHVEAVGVVDVGKDGDAVGADGAADGLGWRHDTEVRMRGEEGGDGAVVLGVGERTGGVDEGAAGADVRCVGGEDGELALVVAAQVGCRGLPAQVGRASSGAGAAAGGVDEDAVVEAVCGGRG